MSDLAALERALGHRFTRGELLVEALTHTSLERRGRVSLERLEFLGDRVLGLIVAEELYRRHPKADADGLSPRLHQLVRRETLALVAEAIELGRYLRLSKAEAGQGGRTKPAILADAMEAVIAALYLDGGLDAAGRFVRQHWATLLATLAEAPKDAKSRLQEWAQGRGRAVPAYLVVETSGPDHDPNFTIEVAVEGEAAARGQGKSKRLAEQAAAEALLARLLGVTP
ncbi:MAG: ribonuclease III [Alphaproteobacteria bacterium]|nr:ribonuclease III [Alphaproteobacteria bacterium]